MRRLVKALKALTDETRLRMLNILAQRECCVCKVMQVLQLSQTRTSRNLAALYDAGFLQLRREGAWAYYRIDRDAMEGYAIKLLEAIADGLKDNETAENDLAYLERVERLGPVCSFSETAEVAQSG